MITQINLSNFKCFEKLSLPFSPLTLFSGFNAGGKSSAYQSLLLLAQTLRSNRKQSATLVLNGELVKLGSPGEVLYNKATKKEVIIDIHKNDCSFESIIELKENALINVLQINTKNINKENNSIKEFDLLKDSQFFLFKDMQEDLTEFIDFIFDIVYISAIRGGPLDVYPAPEDPLPSNADVGIKGEFAPWWFFRQLDEEIDENRRHYSEKALTLRRQFNAWASELFPGAQGHVQPIEKTNLMRLQFRIREQDEWLRPANIGYGLSYAFPVLVAGLLAKKGQVLIIDSPEAHLHPLGQSKMGYFLAQIASAGVQVIIETHSDHILNGVRLALMERVIRPKKVCLHFFIPLQVAEKHNKPQIISPQVDQHGNLSEWPEGFFDQSEKDLMKLAGWE